MQVPAEDYMLLVCRAIESILAEAESRFESHEEYTAQSPGIKMDSLQTALAHLLLETVPSPLCLPSQVSAAAVQLGAVLVFEQSLRLCNLHLALKVAQRFNVQMCQNGEMHLRAFKG